MLLWSQHVTPVTWRTVPNARTYALRSPYPSLTDGLTVYPCAPRPKTSHPAGACDHGQRSATSNACTGSSPFKYTHTCGSQITDLSESHSLLDDLFSRVYAGAYSRGGQGEGNSMRENHFWENNHLL